MKKPILFSIVSVLVMLVSFSAAASGQEFNIQLSNFECLDLESASQVDSVRLVVAQCNSASTTQRFQIVNKVGSSAINIKVTNSRCLEILAAQPTDGVNITQFPCDNSPEQAFQLSSFFSPTSTATISGPISFTHSPGKCFDARDRPFVKQFPCNGSANQLFQIKPVAAFSPTGANQSKFLNGWAQLVAQKMPTIISGIELKNATSICPLGCGATSGGNSFLQIDGMSNRMTAGSQLTSLSNGLKPFLLVDYCKSGATQRGLNLFVRIFDMNGASANSYFVTPHDCSPANTPTVPTPQPPSGGPNTSEQIMWDSVKSSSNAADYQRYLNAFPFGPNAALAKQRIQIFGGQTPVTQPPSGGQNTSEQILWDSIKNSSNAADYQRYLNAFPFGPNAAVARQRIQIFGGQTPVTQPPSQAGTSTFMIALDCAHNALRDTDTGNAITVSFLDASGNLINGARSNGVRNCVQQDTTFSITTNRAVSQVQISTNGNDAFFIDKWRLFQNGTEIRRHGTDNTRGWCLSTDPNDTAGWSGFLAAGCTSRLSFSVAGGGAVSGGGLTPTPAGPSSDQVFWDSVKNSSNPSDFQRYLNAFPNGKFATEARNRITGANLLQNAQQGSISELSRSRKFWIVADDFSTKSTITNAIRRQLPQMSAAVNEQSADFFIVFETTDTTTGQKTTNDPANPNLRGEMMVFTLVPTPGSQPRMRIHFKIVKERGFGVFSRTPAENAARDFAKELAKIII